MSITGEPGTPPTRFPLPVADIVTGLYSALAIQAALLARGRTGQGQFLDLSLQASQLTWLTNVSGAYFATGALPPKVGNAHPSISPYGVFHAQDEYLIVAAGTPKLWHALCTALDAEALENDPRFATNKDRILNRPELTETLNELLGQQDREHWLEALSQAGIPCSPILNVDQALDHPQIQHRQMIVEQEHPTAGTIHSVGNPILFSQTPVSYRHPPPRLGEHTDQVLQWLGHSRDEIDRLREEGAI
jgi:crotonobetainyl-CoA:carnitine CoA-transferase CaiB-like acyl-CoA transferase